MAVVITARSLFPELVFVCEACGRVITHPVSLLTRHGRVCRRRVLGLNRAGRRIGASVWRRAKRSP